MKHLIAVLLVLVMVMPLTAAAPVAAQATPTITIYYQDDSGWKAAAGNWKTENFDDITLNPELSVTATWLGARIIDGRWYDRLVAPGQYDDDTGQWGPTTTTWTFAEPIYAFGGTWDPGGPGGPGTSIKVSIDGSWMFVGVIPRDYENEFWGFVSDVPFTQVLLEPYSSLTGWCETYALDNLVYSSLPPSPGIKVTNWELTNLWGGFTISKVLAVMGDVSGHVIDSRFDIFIPDDDSVWLVEVKYAIGDEVIVRAVPKVEPGHYSLRVQHYIFVWSKYLDYLAQYFTLMLTCLGIPCFHFSVPEPLPEASIQEIIILDLDPFARHVITKSETGQTLPMQLPIYGQDEALYPWEGEWGTFLIGQCPIDILVTDKQDRRIGALYKEGVFISEVNEIEAAFYGGAGQDCQFIHLPEPEQDCTVEVIGTNTGDYTLDILTFPGESNNSFSAVNIPIVPGSIHQYSIDWNALSRGEKGVTVTVDSDGDGVFERSFTTGSVLTSDEFVLKTETIVTIDPETLNLQARSRWITAYIELPDDYAAEDIDIGTVQLLYNDNELGADWGDVQNGVLMIKFDRATVAGWFEGLHDEEAELMVAGEVNGIQFEGTVAIRIIDPPRPGAEGEV